MTLLQASVLTLDQRACQGWGKVVNVGLRVDAVGRRADLISGARASGATWRQIADTLGMIEHGAIKASKPAAPQGRPRQE